MISNQVSASDVSSNHSWLHILAVSLLIAILAFFMFDSFKSKPRPEEHIERKRSECIVSGGIFDYRINYIPFIGTIVSTACEPSSSFKEASR